MAHYTDIICDRLWVCLLDYIEGRFTHRPTIRSISGVRPRSKAHNLMCPMPQDESDLGYSESEGGLDGVLVQRTPCGSYE